jgi:hypothetical protein
MVNLELFNIIWSFYNWLIDVIVVVIVIIGLKSGLVYACITSTYS